MNNESILIWEDKLFGKNNLKKKTLTWSVVLYIGCKTCQTSCCTRKVNSDGECVIKGGVDYA